MKTCSECGKRKFDASFEYSVDDEGVFLDGLVDICKDCEDTLSRRSVRHMPAKHSWSYAKPKGHTVKDLTEKYKKTLALMKKNGYAYKDKAEKVDLIAHLR